MPMPQPKPNEDKQAFVSRCIKTITENERDRFPDAKQRAAICYTQWDEYQNEHGHPERAEK